MAWKTELFELQNISFYNFISQHFFLIQHNFMEYAYQFDNVNQIACTICFGENIIFICDGDNCSKLVNKMQTDNKHFVYCRACANFHRVYCEQCIGKLCGRKELERVSVLNLDRCQI